MSGFAVVYVINVIGKAKKAKVGGFLWRHNQVAQDVIINFFFSISIKLITKLNVISEELSLDLMGKIRWHGQAGSCLGALPADKRSDGFSFFFFFYYFIVDDGGGAYDGGGA